MAAIVNSNAAIQKNAASVIDSNAMIQGNPRSLEVGCKISSLPVSVRLSEGSVSISGITLLHPMTLFFPSGSSTCIIAAPGAGTTTLLRIISTHQSLTTGTLTLPSGTDGRKICAFSDSEDNHEPLLSLRESISLVERFRNPPSCTCDACTASTPASLLQALGLVAAADRWASRCSGGERRRLTVAEALATRPRVLCVDDLSTGLDSTTALAVVRLVVQYAAHSRGVVVASLKQPSAELLAAFSHCLLLSEGRLLFHGPVAAVASYFTSIVGRPPVALDLPLPDQLGEIVAFSSTGDIEQLASAWREHSLEEEGEEESTGDIEQLASAWREHSLEEEGEEEEEVAAPVRVPAPPADSRSGSQNASAPPAIHSTLSPTHRPMPYYKMGCNLPFLWQLWVLLGRDVTITLRDAKSATARILPSIIMGLILLTLFADLTSSSFQARIGLALYSCVFFAVQNQGEVANVYNSRCLMYRQTQAKLYHTSAFTTSLTLTKAPVALLAAIIFSVLVYWPLGWAPPFTHYLFFLCTLYLLDQCIAAIFRSLAALPTAEIASTIGTLIFTAFLLFSGVFVLRNDQPVFLSWCAYIDPFWYAVTALTNNEFSYTPHYPYSIAAAFMDSYNYPFSNAWQWFSFMFLLLLFPIMACGLLPLCHGSMKLLAPRGSTRRRTIVPDGITEVGVPPMPPPPAAVATAVTAAALVITAILPTPPPPTVLAWTSLKLRFSANEHFTLRHNVSGSVHPGQLHALLGSSGAGKTSLLNALAMRSDPSAKLSGSCTLNGLPYTPSLAASATGFAEQFDSHFEYATVRESLTFAASLRLPVQTGECVGILNELDLTGVADLLVRDLSRGERKRLTIGVALLSAGRSGLLLLDEPLTGLDLLQALAVLRALCRLARDGRGILLTVHQPSPSLWLMFTHVTIIAKSQGEGYCAFSGSAEEMVPAIAAFTHKNPPTGPFDKPAWCLAALEEAESDANTVSAIALEVESIAAASAAAEAAAAAGALSSAPQASSSSPPLHPTAPAEPVIALHGDTWGRRVPWISKLRLLIIRAWLDTIRRWGFLSLRLTVTICQALLFGLILLGLQPDTFSGAQTILGFSLSAPSIAGLTGLAAGVALWFSRKPATLRELKSNFYAPSAYGVSTFVVDFPVIIFIAILFCSIVYFIPPLPGNPLPSTFFFFFLANCILSGFFAALAQFFTTLAPSQELAQAGGGLCIGISFLFAGLYIAKPHIPRGWVGLYYAVPTSHILRAIATSQTFCLDELDCPAFTLPGPDATRITVNNYVQSYLGIHSSQQFLWNELAWASLAVVVVLLATLLRLSACPMR